MGMLRKAAVGSLIIGLGALAVSQNKKASKAVKKTFDKAVKTIRKESGKLIKAGKKTARKAAKGR